VAPFHPSTVPSEEQEGWENVPEQGLRECARTEGASFLFSSAYDAASSTTPTCGSGAIRRPGQHSLPVSSPYFCYSVLRSRVPQGISTDSHRRPHRLGAQLGNIYKKPSAQFVRFAIQTNSSNSRLQTASDGQWILWNEPCLVSRLHCRSWACIDMSSLRRLRLRLAESSGCLGNAGAGARRSATTGVVKCQ
jgi:hypothetical protein